MATIEQRLVKLESAVKKITRPFKLIMVREDLPQVEAMAIIELERAAAEADGFNTICTIPAEWKFNQEK